MEWLLIAALVIWVALIQMRLGTMKRQLRMLGAPERSDPPVRRSAPAFEPPPTPAPRAAEPAPAPEPWSNPEPLPVPARVEPADPVRRPDLAETRKQLEAVSNWMAENGLAWLGGGALALGGLFMVVYAAQRGFFTPAMRVGAAAVLGLVMLAVSEWIRRQTNAPGGRHQLAAAATAGAGAATIYGAIWAAEQLYQLIPFELAAILIGLLSAGLLAYALLQGEALAILGLAGAFAAPLVTGVKDWGSPTLELYLAVLIATGFAFSGLRRWAVAGYVTLAGAVIWSIPALVEGPTIKAALLLLAGAVGPVAVLGLRHEQQSDAPVDNKPDAFRLQPVVALGVVSLISLSLWGEGPLWVPVSLTAALAALSVFAAARGLAPAWTLAGPVGAAVLGVLSRALIGFHPFVRPADIAAAAVLPALVAVVGLVGALRKTPARDMALAVGGVGAAVLASLIWPLLRKSGVEHPWAPAAAIAAMMAVGGAVIARTLDDRQRDRGLGLWFGGAAELLFLTILAAFDATWAPAVQALAALGLAGLAVRLRWSGLDRCAVAGGLVALASMLLPDFLRPALANSEPLLQLAFVGGASAVVVLAAGYLLRAGGRLAEAEAAETAALMIALLDGFLIIHRLIAGQQQLGLSEHMAASLRTVLMLAAGLLLAIQARPEDGVLARWRLRAVLVAGVVHGLILQALVLGPWWGLGDQPLGPPVINTLMLSYLAPAAILLAVARKGLAGSPRWTRAMAAAGFVFGLIWALLALRHAFHPHDMSAGAVGRSEGLSYVALLVATGAGLIELRRRAQPGDVRGAAWLEAAAQPAAWTALGVSALALWVLASPWWGADTTPLASSAAALLLFGGYALVAGLTAAVGDRAARLEGQGWSWLVQAVIAVVFVDLFVLTTLLVRYGFHGAAMAKAITDPRLETWVYSAVWALYGLAALVAGGVKRNVTLRWLGLAGLLLTLGKVFLFDMSRLDGVVRAGSFLAVGGLLVAGALAARRLNAGALFARPEGP